MASSLREKYLLKKEYKGAENCESVIKLIHGKISKIVVEKLLTIQIILRSKSKKNLKIW